MASKWEKNIGQNIGYDTDSMIESFRDITQHTDNTDRYDAAMSNMSQLIQRREDWLRSQPAAQVERLMAAGMSRAQALSALNSTGESPIAQTGIAGNVEQSKTDTIQAVGNLVSQAIQLAEQAVGIGAQLGLANSTIAVNSIQAQLYATQRDQIATSNSFARLQYDSLTDVASFMQAAHNYEQRTGKPLSDNWDAAFQELYSASYESMPDVHSLTHGQYQKALENPYFYPAMLLQWRDKRRNDFDIVNERKRTSAEAEFASIGVEQANQELINARAEYGLIKAEEDNLRAQSRLAKEKATTEGTTRTLQSSQAALFHEQYARTYKENEVYFSTDEHGNSVLRKRLEGESQASYYEGALAAINYDMQENYVNPLQQHILLRELKSWQNMPESYWKNKRDNLLKSEENQRIVLDVLSMSLSNNKEFRQKCPNLTTFFDLFDTYGFFDSALRAFTTVTSSSIIGSSAVGSAIVGQAGRAVESAPPLYMGSGKLF